MNVIVVATKTCHHCPDLNRLLNDFGIPHIVQYAEKNPELVKKYLIAKSPTIIVDDEVVFRGMPPISDLKKFFKID